MKSKHLVIEIRSSKNKKFLTYYASSLQVHLYEKFGELKLLTNESTPISQAYVKVFAKVNGKD